MDDKLLSIIVAIGIILVLSLLIVLIFVKNKSSQNMNGYKVKVSRDGVNINGNGSRSGLSGFCEDRSDTLLIGVSKAINRIKVEFIDMNNGYRYEANLIDSVIVGRSNEFRRANYLEFSGYKTISKEHLIMISNNGYIYIQDLGSSNHTWHNGRLLEGQEVLYSGDVIRMGSAEFYVEVK